MQLPKEAVYNILLNLTLNEVNSNCRLNKRYTTICQSKQFWIDYANKHYWLKLSDDMDLKEVKRLILKADRVVKLISKYQSLVKYDNYLYIIFVIEDKDIALIINDDLIKNILYLSDILNDMGLNDRYNHPPSPGPPLEPGTNFTRVDSEYILNDKGERNYNLIWKNIIKPTLYTNGKELLVINYDPDFDYDKYSMQDSLLTEMIYDNINNYLGDIYKKYLY